MTEFERITQSPETLGAFLASLPCIDGPWDVEFQKRFCSGCARADCDGAEPCPHAAERSNPGWWLTLAAGQTAGTETHVIDLDPAETEKPLTAEEEKELQKSKGLFHYTIECGEKPGVVKIIPMEQSGKITLRGETEVRLFIKLLLDSVRETGTVVRNA